jgi:hypothetical protein
MSDANKTLLSYALETAFAETPDLASVLLDVRFLSESLAHRKDTVVSEEIRADRVRSGVVQVGQGAEGSIETEMIVGAYNDWILASLQSSAFSVSSDAVTADIDETAETITATAGTFSATTQAARYIKVTGATNPTNNGIKRLVSASSTVLTLAATTTGGDALDTAEVGSALTISTRYARNGTTLRTYLIEKHFTGPTVPRFNGVIGSVFNEWALNMEAQARILQTFGMMGAKMIDGTTTYGDGANTVASVRDIVNSTSNVGSVLLDGAALAVNLSGFSMSLNNNLRERPAVGRLFTLEHGSGTIDLTGAIETYFEDGTLLAKFLNHTSFSLDVPIIDADGNLFSVHIPKAYISDEGAPTAGGINTDIILTNNFQATYDATAGYLIQVDQLDVV